MANPVKLAARVESVVPHGERVYSVTLHCAQRLPRYRPGQFLHLTVDPFDPSSGFWPESRVFSIASRSGTDRVRVVYAVKGRYTQKMESALVPGAEVWLKLPYGDFVIERAAAIAQDLVLVAGGTGIAPFVPFLEDLAESGAPRPIVLAYGVRTTGLCLFDDLVRRCEEKAGFGCHLFVEGGEVPPTTGARVVHHGRLTPAAVVEAARELREPVFFLSGPPAMVETFRVGLASLGVPSTRIRFDEWS